MNQSELISVIVPVYKVEKYLDRCVQSIVDQTFRNLEIILVDDGSPDNCPAMCDAWAAKDSRIKVIHKENGGSGLARNVALNIAEGQYVGFVDSDDYIAPHMYEYLLGLMTDNIDIVECNYKETFDNHVSFLEGDNMAHQEYSTYEALSNHINDTLFRQIIWNKLYRRKTIDGIRFPAGSLIDDEFWTYRVIANARKLVHTSCKMYAYRQQPESVMHLSFSLPRLQAVDAKCQRLILLQEKFPELVPQARINLWYTCLHMGQMSLLHMEEAEKNQAFEKLYVAKKKYPLTNDDKRSLPLQQRIWAILSELSFPTACKLRNCLKVGI